MDSQLRCRYYKGQDGFFSLQPIKLEEINLKPYVIVMHDVVQDKDIEDLMAFAEPRLERSTTYTGNEMMPSPERTSSTAWLNEDEAPIAVRMNSYLRALLGMGTSDTDEEAEAYQLANYGTGGHFLPHHDFLQDSLQADNSVTGDRLATLMIYMTDVEEGGTTVFPNLGIRLTPKKGDAAFWWNLKASGDGERLTTHAGCPVLYGSKWIANKWFRSYSNVFRLPLFHRPECFPWRPSSDLFSKTSCRSAECGYTPAVGVIASLFISPECIGRIAACNKIIGDHVTATDILRNLGHGISINTLFLLAVQHQLQQLQNREAANGGQIGCPIAFLYVFLPFEDV
ncbi:prolyl 4-hydroxylase alpha subunit 1, putative [Ixodes scapularis]|uniref:Prolyl 4-hydroxylase alpha subunit 1, putative n=1 Tax=Ixodes scapularis TaxID=6945 RepID=B7PTN6_IXOSC|nr:prolyl 4-hydroxylase alpha subunit 1, putative [Ixodes scapularis]|eukprot:XP_002404733.1 prolyl 4-hydroxylase alpha subunit 1, putative [Ixodes scapularis]